MLKHYLAMFSRGFVRQFLYSSLNVLGLGISLAVALIVGLFVHHELSYERDFEHAERIYLIGQTSSTNRFGSPDASSPRVAVRFPALFPAIEEMAQATFPGPVLIGSMREEGSETVENMECCLGYADERFFHLFTVDWLYGEAGSALTQPDSVVLTAPLARKYFGSEAAAFGSMLQYERERPVRVTGVIAEFPDNTVLQYQALFSMNLFQDIYSDRGQRQFIESWEGTVLRTYARFDRQVPGAQLLAEMQDLIDVELGELAETITFNIRPLTGLYLAGNMGRVVLFAGIGLAILLIAVINFVNLATARSSTRALEVALRRSLGGTRAQLLGQFLAESAVMVCLAMAVALVLGELLLPVASQVLDVQLSYAVFREPEAFALLIAATLGLGLLAGLYPAFHLSALTPVHGLKKEGMRGRSGRYFRNGLVMVQFSLSIILLVATFVFLMQIRYLDALDRGFVHDKVVVVPFPAEEGIDVSTLWPGLRQALYSHADIEQVNLSQLSPIPEAIMIMPVRQEGIAERQQFSMLSGEPDFLQFYDIDLLTGEYFPPDAANSSLATEEVAARYPAGIILNEAALRKLEWALDDAVGRSLYLGQDDDSTGNVIGVVEDVVVNPLRPPEPYVYAVADRFPAAAVIPPRVNIRLRNQDSAPAMAHIRQVWSDYFPEHLMQPMFPTERVKAQTRRQEDQHRFFTYASGFALLVTCFGLFGLATFNAERRIKEIGVRKVMGGSVWSIVALLTNDFSKLVLLANLIAWPLAYMAMSRWLESFAYRIDLTPMIFIGSGLVALCIAWVTVGGTAAKAASAKPVLALRYE